ncbi:MULTISPECIES: gamma-glutamylcyclotransferase [Maritimibacter]|jgi:cation transport protein ChaC|uniref:gamma-glutamylcyclotransferase n=1 Tax=Maritimibacter TaxID=404235 RepID=UPI001108346E|nr:MULTISPECIES: gamma-glutamylcyclotransferase [Maritimibacter]MBL6426649.1 gamma-glutamylcyclotransferase [Maritimibacter sp.]
MEDDLWVFGYGSLLWNQGFVHVEQVLATLSGYHRSFCMRSIHHRGTDENPGLVLALDAQEGASCRGVAYRVDPDHHEPTMAYLRERELISSAYLERVLPLDLADGRRVQAVAYIIDPEHVQYCHLDLDEQARIIAQAVGGRGPNTEYLYNTAGHLTEVGIEDPDLTWLAREVRRITA